MWHRACNSLRTPETGLFFGLVVPLQPADPNVPETHGLIVILEHEGIFRRLRNVISHVSVEHRTHRFLSVMEEDSIKENRTIGGFYEFLAFELRRLKDNVVGLPLAG